METSTCRKCGNPICFVPTAATGQLMPLDVDPVGDGNVVIRDGKAVVLAKDLFEQRTEELRYLSHFVTCPAADEFRKKKGKKR